MIVDKVSGIGPKIAANLLGSLSLPTLKTSIASGDVGMLSKAQGLGKKTAERIVVELKDKVLPKGTTIEAAPASSLGVETPLENSTISVPIRMLSPPCSPSATKQPKPTRPCERQPLPLAKEHAPRN